MIPLITMDQNKIVSNKIVSNKFGVKFFPKENILNKVILFYFLGTYFKKVERELTPFHTQSACEFRG